MFVRRLREVRDQLHTVTETLDPEVMTGVDAAAAVALCGEIERLAAGARTLLSPRVEATRAWTGQGHRSAAHWLADQAGSSVGEAAAMLSTGKKLGELPATREAVRKGALSPKQAELVAQGAAADPGAEDTLLQLAGDASLGELRKESQRTVAAAEPDEVAAHRRVWRSRFFRHRRDPDGSWVGTIRTTPECGALFMAAVNHLRPRIFDQARRAGGWHTSEAYDADAVVELAREHLRLASTPVEIAEPGPDRPDAPGETAWTPGDSRNDWPGPAEPETPSDMPGGEAEHEVPSNTPGNEAEPESDRSGAGGEAADVSGHSCDESAAATPTPGVAAVLARFPGAGVSPCPGGTECGQASSGQGGGEGPPDAGEPLKSTIYGPSGAATPSEEPAPQRSAPQAAAPTGRGSRASTIVRVDHAALLRGHTLPGEICEITGIGPVAVAVVRELLATAFLAVVHTDAVGEVLKVAHLGRRNRVAQAAASQRPPPTSAGSPRFGWAIDGLGAVSKIIVQIRECDLHGPDQRRTGGLNRAAAGGDAFAEALNSTGVPVAELTHHHRSFNALQRTALEFRDPECIVLGCTATARLEIDHRSDWAATHTTDASDADRRCDHHHMLKTRYGWRLEAGTGKRRLLPPNGPPP